MKWVPKSKWHLESTPPGHTIAKYRVLRDGQLVWVYQAIRLGSPSVVLCEARDAAAAKRACGHD